MRGKGSIREEEKHHDAEKTENETHTAWTRKNRKKSPHRGWRTVPERREGPTERRWTRKGE